jgi:hypothetical protein
LALAFSRGDFSPQDWERCLAYWGNACAVCGTTGDVRSIAADHWIPLFAGGKTDKLNIIPLCHGIGGCNNRKNKKMPDIWLTASMSADGAQSVLSRVAAYFESIAQHPGYAGMGASSRPASMYFQSEDAVAVVGHGYHSPL